MNNNFFVIVLTFAVFSYITSIVHTQYMEQVKLYFTKTKSPIYSYSEFVSSGTSLPLLPVIVLMNIFILTIVAALVYLLFLTVIVSRNSNNSIPLQVEPKTKSTITTQKTPNDLRKVKPEDIANMTQMLPGGLSKLIPDELLKMKPEDIEQMKSDDIEKLLPNGLKNLSKFIPKMTGGKAKIYPLKDDKIKIDNKIKTNKIKTDNKTKLIDSRVVNKVTVDSFDVFSNYLKSMCKSDFIINIFKWFIYVILFQILYFIVFILLVRTNVINKKNLKSQSYVSSLIHYYISGFYISTSIIFFIIMSNS